MNLTRISHQVLTQIKALVLKMNTFQLMSRKLLRIKIFLRKTKVTLSKMNKVNLQPKNNLLQIVHKFLAIINQIKVNKTQLTLIIKERKNLQSQGHKNSKTLKLIVTLQITLKQMVKALKVNPLNKLIANNQNQEKLKINRNQINFKIMN